MDASRRRMLRGGARKVDGRGRPANPNVEPSGGPWNAEGGSGDRKHVDESFPETGPIPSRAGWTAGMRSCEAKILRRGEAWRAKRPGWTRAIRGCRVEDSGIGGRNVITRSNDRATAPRADRPPGGGGPFACHATEVVAVTPNRSLACPGRAHTERLSLWGRPKSRSLRP